MNIINQTLGSLYWVENKLANGFLFVLFCNALLRSKRKIDLSVFNWVLLFYLLLIYVDYYSIEHANDECFFETNGSNTCIFDPFFYIEYCNNLYPML